MITSFATGNLGRNSEVRDAAGTSVCNFPLAATVGFGERKRTVWIDCAVWGERGKRLHEYLTKGKRVAVCGETEVRAYTKKDGEAGASMTMRVQELEFLGDANSDAPRSNTQPQATQSSGIPDDNIPF